MLYLVGRTSFSLLPIAFITIMGHITEELQVILLMSMGLQIEVCQCTQYFNFWLIEAMLAISFTMRILPLD